MPGKLGTLTLDLIAKIGGFTGPLDKANKHSKKTSLDISKHAKRIGIGLAAGVTAGATAIALLVKRERALIDEQAKLAQALGTTYDSISNLNRAAQLTGLTYKQIEVAGRQLDINIGKALQNEKLQAEAFERIGISAKEISELPLDEKIAKVNAALVKNVDAAERSAVAMDLFGAKNAYLSRLLTPEAIAQAAKEVEIFGLNLGDIDAAKVELANDAMSTFGLLTEGAAKQLTVQLAPILLATGQKFLQVAEDAGGLGNIVERTVDKAVNAVAFMANAADGVKRTFEIVADGIIYALSKGQGVALDLVASVLDALDYIPGVDLTLNVESLRASAKEAESVAALAAANIEDTMGESWTGERLKAAYAEAKKGAQAAAEAAIEGRKAALETGEAFEEVDKAAEKSAKSVKDQIDALEKAAETFGYTKSELVAYELAQKGADKATIEYAKSLVEVTEDLEKAEKAQESYKSLLVELQTDEEKLADQMRKRLQILQEVTNISDKERQKARSRIIDAAFSDAPEFKGLSDDLGGPFQELGKVEDAAAELEKWYKKQLDLLNTYREEKLLTAAEWNEQEAELEQAHQKRILEIEKARQVAQVEGASLLFGELADLAKGFYGDQSGIYKRLFIMQKSAALASTLISSADAIAKAWASAPFPGNLPAVALTTVKTGALQAIISSTQLTGMSHDGYDSIPKTGTWFLEKGQRVTTAETSAKLDRVLDDIRGSGRAEGIPAINQNIYVDGIPDSRTSQQIAKDTSKKQRMAVARFG